jgi:glyoxylase-like metal-dependent hydrolase (beta-lactamase superfamily II)
MTEAELADLGVFRIPVPIPFVAAGGPVNAYLVEDRGGGLLLWDAGLGSPEAEAALEAGFRRLGRRFDEVTRIVISHGHVDHYGGARTVQEKHGGALPVYAHPDDVPKIAEDGWRWRDRMPLYGAYLLKLGVPAERLAAIGQEGERGFRLARRLPEVRAIGEGEVLRTRHLELRVLHMPGHTPGLLCLHDAAHRLFFSDDHLLERISPNPLIELGPRGEEGFFKPLVAYLASVARVRALELDLVLPGHGPPFSGHREVIDRLVAFYAKRQDRIREVLAKGPATCAEVAAAIFPSARPGDAFLVLSETIANLEAMEERGEVSRGVADGVYRFR